MNRADAATYIGQRYLNYLDAAERDAKDTVAGLKPAIDDALRALGYAEDDLATADVDEGETLTDYRLQLALRSMQQIVRDLRATYMNVGLSGKSFNLKDLREGAEHELKELTDAVLARFGTLDVVSADASSGIVTVDLNMNVDCDDWLIA